MQCRMKIILAMLLTAIIAVKALGETPSDSVKVYFRVGYSQFDPAFDNNGKAMDRFISLLTDANKANEIDSIVVRGYASPDGNSDANVRLSRLRCATVAELISGRADIRPSMIKTIPEGIAWGELRKMVYDNPVVPSRDKILHILDNVPVWVFNRQGAIVDGRKKQLMELDRGETYKWLLTNIFPLLRNSVAICLYTREPKKDSSSPAGHIEQMSISGDSQQRDQHKKRDIIEPLDSTTATELADSIEFSDSTGLKIASDTFEISDSAEELRETNVTSVIEQYVTSVEANHRAFNMAIKTNMLYDAALIPNIGAEFYLGKDLSIYGEWMYAWWDNNKRHRYWRVYGGDLGLRWWFGKKANAKPLTGHHLGIYGGILTFDFETGNTGYMGGKPGGTLWDRWLLNAGIEYGYSLPVAKRLNIDFSIGLGCLTGNYIKYYPFDNDYYFDKEYHMLNFGLTKAEISLVWLIGRGNTNDRKGGDR